MALLMNTPRVSRIALRKTIPVRNKSSKSKKAKTPPKNPPPSRAVKYFDDFYQPIFQNKWPSIRLGLLSPHKYCALLNNYSNLQENIELLKQIEATSLRELYETEVDKAEHLVNLNRNVCEEGDKKKEKRLDSANEMKLDSSNAVEDVNDLSEFVPPSRLKGMEGMVDETDHAKHYDTKAKMPFNKKILAPLTFFPRHLHIYIYDKNNFSLFPQPKRDSLNLFSYYLMDISSILPPLALNTQPDDLVLDLCSAPGGKAMNIIQSLAYKSIVCNDLNRAKRLKHVFQTYFTDLSKMNISITEHDAEKWPEPNAYNKVLVDVPCTNDRDSTVNNENNIFSHARLRERILLPECQINKLYSGLKAVKVGGTVVYSTCSLSPIQNDGVVHMALNKIWQEGSEEFVISDLSEFIKPFKFLFSFHDKMRYGQLVLPYLPLNCGPTYFCRLERVK